MIASFAVNMIQEMDSTEAFSLIDEDRLRARQDSLGMGVTYEGVEEVSEGGYQGYVATYSFMDINQVELTENSDALQLGDSDEDGEDNPTEGLTGAGLESVAFFYQPGVLEVHIPREVGSEADIHPDSLAAETERIRQQMEEQGQMIRAFLDDARFSASIVLPGTITETNASFADSNRVTLVDIVLGSIFDLMEENPELAARMELAKSDSERQTLLAGMGESDEFRYEARNEIVIRFE